MNFGCKIKVEGKRKVKELRQRPVYPVIPSKGGCVNPASAVPIEPHLMPLPEYAGPQEGLREKPTEQLLCPASVMGQLSRPQHLTR